MLKAIAAIANAIRTAVGGLLQISGPTAGSTRTMTVPDADFTAARTDSAQTFTGDQRFDNNLGVGVAPSYKLHVAGVSNTVAFGITGTVASNSNGVYFAPSAITGSFNFINGATSATTGTRAKFVNTENATSSSHSIVDIEVGGGSGGDPKLNFTISGVLNWSFGVDNSDSDRLKLSASANPGTNDCMIVDVNKNVVINSAAIATTATDGFLYVPGCAGAPTGTPTSYTGRVPLVVDTTNHKLYFYSGGTWRDAGP